MRGGDGDVHRVSAIVGQHHQDEQEAAPHRGNHEEVGRRQLCPMVRQERAPSLRWWLPAAAMYFAAVAPQMSMPSFCSSPWIRGAPQSGFASDIVRISALMTRPAKALHGKGD